MSARRPSAAPGLFARAHAIEPRADEIRINLGNALLAVDRWQDANVVMEPMGDTLNGWWASARATAIDRHGAGRRRVRRLLRLRRIEALDRDSAIELAGLLLNLGWYAAAQALCEALVRDDPADFAPVGIGASLVVARGGIADGIAWLEAVESRFGGFAAFEVQLAGYLYEAGRTDAALRHAAKAGDAMEPAAFGFYLISAERWDELYAFARAWMERTDDTTPFSLAIRAGLGQGRLRMLGEGDPAAPGTVPRTIQQYWSQDVVPGDVAETMATWRRRHPHYRHALFNDRTAAGYIAEHFPNAAAAFVACHHPAMRSDFFRICFLAREGGFYVDADDACVRPLDALRDAIGGAGFAALLSSDLAPHARNGFLAAMPGNRIAAMALRDMVRGIARLSAQGRRADIWHTTGPGLLTRAVARWLAAGGGAGHEALFLTGDQVGGFARTIEDLGYKSTAEGNWRIAGN